MMTKSGEEGKWISALDMGKWLTGWLNDGEEFDGDKSRMLNVIVLLQKLESVLRQNPPGTLWALVPEIPPIHKSLAELTRNYRTWPMFGVPGFSGELFAAGLDSVRFAGFKRGASGIGVARVLDESNLCDFAEGRALQTIEYLVLEGMLGRLNLCEQCKQRWVFHWKREKYCSRKCRQSRYEATPGRKELKKKHNQEYYDRWIAPERKRQYRRRKR